MNKTYVQCNFLRGDLEHPDRLTAFIPYDKRIQVGTELELKDVEGVWTVAHIGVAAELKEIHNTWHNNI